nr:nucleotide/sugar transporter family protein isoform X1 [Solanum lycopersicum]
MAWSPFSSSSTPLCSSLTRNPTNSLCKTSSLCHHYSLNHSRGEFLQYPNTISFKNLHFRTKKFTACSRTESGVEQNSPPSSSELDCVGTGLDVECVVNPSEEFPKDSNLRFQDEGVSSMELLQTILEWVLLISPFFFWGTAMVAMKEVLPKTGPFFVSSFRLIPAGLMLVGFAASRGRNLPSGFNAWLSITLFAVVDATCFQGFLAEGLQRTSAGLGSVPALSFDNSNFSIWGSGEWWMFLAAQSMAVGTVMVRWVSKYSDPVMATGWHMVIGGLPLVAISILNHEPVISGSLMELTTNDLLALLYTSIFGSAISYGVYFYNATRGSLTKLSSLTFLTPMFASIFGFLYLDEIFTPVQLIGAFVTVAAIYMVNYKSDTK